MEVRQNNALAIIQRDAAALREIRTHQTMISLAQNANGRNYDFNPFEYSLEDAHMRRSQRVHGYRARFNNIDLLRFAFNSPGITVEDTKRGVFVINAKFQDMSMKSPIVLPVTVDVMGMDGYNSVDFGLMFETFGLAVEDLKDELNEHPNGLKLTNDMRVFARRDLLNRALNYLTMTSDEALELLQSTGNYDFEDSIKYGSFSTFGFDEEKLLYLFVYCFTSNMNKTLASGLAYIPSLIVPLETAGDDETFVNRFVNCIRIFGDPKKLINLARRTRNEREYVAVQLKTDQRFWTTSSLDALRFFAMYLYLNAEVHQFLGNDEITSVLSLAILWMASHASPTSMATIKKHGFYRLLMRYILDTSMIPYPFRFVNVNGKRHEAIPYDCFQMQRMCKIVPLGMGELFIGSDIVSLYPNGLPRNRVLPMLPVQITNTAGNAARGLYPDTLEMERLSFR